MDTFDYDSLDNYIKKYKSNIVNKLDNIQLTEKALKNQADLLCLVLEYSPRVIEDKKPYEKIKIKNNTLLSDSIEHTTSGRSLNLENKASDENEENEEEIKDSKDAITKMSTFSKKVSNIEPVIIKAELEIGRGMILEIIGTAAEIAEKKIEEEEEYYRQLEQRRKKYEEEDTRKGAGVPKKMNNSYETDKAFTSKFATKFSEMIKIRVFFFSTPHYCDFQVTINDTMKDLKQKALAYLESEGKIKLKYYILEAYELRLIDEDEEMPNMEWPALDDKQNVVKSRNNTLAFVEKSKFNPDLDLNLNTPNILGSIVKDSETVFNIDLNNLPLENYIENLF